jgi:hypothetical protein
MAGLAGRRLAKAPRQQVQFLLNKLQHVQYSMQNKWVKDDPSNG